MHRQEDLLQENVLALKQTQACNGQDEPHLVDHAQLRLAQQVSTSEVAGGAKPIVRDGEAGASSAILFLDDRRLTRDCLSEAIQDLCPDMIIVGLRPADYAPEAIKAHIAIIIFNLHDATISEAARLLRIDRGRSASPPVLFITSRDQRRETMEAVDCGATGLVRADACIELLVAAIRLVIAGGGYFPAETIKSLMVQTPATKNLP